MNYRKPASNEQLARIGAIVPRAAAYDRNGKKIDLTTGRKLYSFEADKAAINRATAKRTRKATARLAAR